jgi:lipopolysaccharide transport system ATP-binding protein
VSINLDTQRMSDIAIKVDNLSKKYIIGSGTSGSLRETLSNVWHNTFGGKRSTEEEFWALQDINFEIKQGEAVGIIGRNGAGKSTLLKLLSKITYPTTGNITMNGRVSSLLEVGTGFHPELTGRENIYLNGTILGMSRKEVKSKFDEIVDFSGVEKFLDTPVKRYSSGMYVRLAFAVAAHLEPEILIVDEVLAVGDAEFQKKCLGKMDEVAKGGRTVLFVSHNMGAIESLCNTAIQLSNGKIIDYGLTAKVIESYYSNRANSKLNSFDGFIELLSVDTVDYLLEKKTSFNLNEAVGISINYRVLNKSVKPKVSVYLNTHSAGEPILLSIDTLKQENTNLEVVNKTVWFPKDFLSGKTYYIDIAISSFDPHVLHIHEKSIVQFTMVDRINSLNRQGFTGALSGYLRPTLEWTSENIK